MAVEFLPFHQPGNSMLRCEGAQGCGALVMSDDAERHERWHLDQLVLNRTLLNILPPRNMTPQGAAQAALDEMKEQGWGRYL